MQSPSNSFHSLAVSTVTSPVPSSIVPAHPVSKKKLLSSSSHSIHPSHSSQIPHHHHLQKNQNESLPSYQEVLELLTRRVQMPKTAPGLEKTREALSRLKLNISAYAPRTILVAGTNGKGSVCRALEHFILAAGFPTFLYTSPHLVDTRERIRINGQSVSSMQFQEAFVAIDSLTADLNLSHFETLTVMATWLAHQQQKKTSQKYFFIWEVGMGGTWDATNALPHSTSVITSIDFDHQDILGHTLEEIAENKFGIIQPHNLVIFSSQLNPKLKNRLQQISKNLKAKIRSSVWPKLYTQCAFPHPKNHVYLLQKYFRLPEGGGQRFADNLMIALETLQHLQISAEPGLQSLTHDYYWPGRGDVIFHPEKNIPIMLSGDHNPQGMASLKEILSQVNYEKVYFLVGIGINKSSDEILNILQTIPRSQSVLTKSPFQGRTALQFSSWINKGIPYCENPEESLNSLLKQATAKDLVVVTGSLYLVGKIYELALKDGWLSEYKRKFFSNYFTASI